VKLSVLVSWHTTPHSSSCSVSSSTTRACRIASVDDVGTRVHRIIGPRHETSRGPEDSCVQCTLCTWRERAIDSGSRPPAVNPALSVGSAPSQMRRGTEASVRHHTGASRRQGDPQPRVVLTPLEVDPAVGAVSGDEEGERFITVAPPDAGSAAFTSCSIVVREFSHDWGDRLPHLELRRTLNGFSRRVCSESWCRASTPTTAASTTR
jgi:hypothetical protein